jgi:acetyl-CoA acetyltransferase
VTFVNPLMQARFGVDPMIDTAENVAAEFAIARADQDAFALRSQQRCAAAQAAGRFAIEITPVITHRLGYTEFAEGFAAMASGEAGKVVLDWT